MARTKDDLPVRAIARAARETVQVMHEVAQEEAKEISKEEVTQHVEEYHKPLPGRRFDIPKAVPFQSKHIPDRVLKQVAERLARRGDDSSNEDIEALAVIFGYPTILLERELARYIGANKRYHHLLQS